MGMRCTGHCCRTLQICWSPGQLKEAYLAKLADDFGFTYEGVWTFEIADILTMYPMLTNVGRAKAGDVVEGRVIQHDCYLYTCLHHMPCGDCAIYQQRPGMCSGFPYGDTCPYPGCTFTPDGCTQEPE